MTPQHSHGRVTIPYQWRAMVDMFSAALIDAVLTLICFCTCEGHVGQTLALAGRLQRSRGSSALRRRSVPRKPASR